MVEGCCRLIAVGRKWILSGRAGPMRQWNPHRLVDILTGNSLENDQTPCVKADDSSPVFVAATRRGNDGRLR